MNIFWFRLRISHIPQKVGVAQKGKGKGRLRQRETSGPWLTVL